MLKALFAAVDRMDTEAFAGYLSDGCRFCFGNQAPVVGLDPIKSYIGGFFRSLRGLHHEITESWPVSDGIVCHGVVNYTRHDGSQLQVPFCNLLKIHDGKITEYLIFADNSALYLN